MYTLYYPSEPTSLIEGIIGLIVFIIFWILFIYFGYYLPKKIKRTYELSNRTKDYLKIFKDNKVNDKLLNLIESFSDSNFNKLPMPFYVTNIFFIYKKGIIFYKDILCVIPDRKVYRVHIGGPIEYRYYIEFCLSQRNKIRIKFYSQLYLDLALLEIYKYCKNCFYGYDKKQYKLYNKDFLKFKEHYDNQFENNNGSSNSIDITKIQYKPEKWTFL